MLPSSCAWWLGWRRLLWGIRGEAGRCGEAGGKCWEGRRQASSSRLSATVQEHDLSSKIGQFSRSQDHEEGGHGSDVFHKGQTFTRTSSFLYDLRHFLPTSTDFLTFFCPCLVNFLSRFFSVCYDRIGMPGNSNQIIRPNPLFKFQERLSGGGQKIC